MCFWICSLSVENQITTFVTSRFYECITWISRISVSFGGEEFISHAVRGYGYAELVQKYDSPVIPPSAPEFAGFSYDSLTRMIKITWHPSIAGTYPAAGYRVYHLDSQNSIVIKYFQVSQDTFIEIPVPPDNRLTVMISTFDSASAVNGIDLAGPFIFTGVNEITHTLLPVKIKFTNNGKRLDIFTDGNWSLNVVSADGRVVKRFKGIGESRIKLKLKPGVYFTIFRSKHYQKIFRFTVVY